jgi:hypothetical protein
LKQGGSRITEFNGIALDIHKSSLPDGKFQVDQGGDPFRKGSWKRRRGMRHTDIAKASSGVDTLLGFAMPGGQFALMVVNGANCNGFVGTAEQ